jgi:hypothetical protein
MSVTVIFVNLHALDGSYGKKRWATWSRKGIFDWSNRRILSLRADGIKPTTPAVVRFPRRSWHLHPVSDTGSPCTHVLSGVGVNYCYSAITTVHAIGYIFTTAYPSRGEEKT